jgi:hypothetical protein
MAPALFELGPAEPFEFELALEVGAFEVEALEELAEEATPPAFVLPGEITVNRKINERKRQTYHRVPDKALRSLDCSTEMQHSRRSNRMIQRCTDWSCNIPRTEDWSRRRYRIRLLHTVDPSWSHIELQES